MTLPANDGKTGPYDTDGATTQFAYDFRIDNKNEIRVVFTNANGTDVDLVVDVDFTVDGIGNANGGNVTTTTAYASGNKVTNLYGVPMSQTTDLSAVKAYSPTTVEDRFDQTTKQIQELAEKLSRANLSGVTNTAYVDPTAISGYKQVSTTTYTVLSTDAGMWIDFTNAAGCAVTLSDGLPTNFTFVAGSYTGSGTISFTATTLTAVGDELPAGGYAAAFLKVGATEWRAAGGLG